MHPELKLTTMRYIILTCFAAAFMLAAFIPVQHFTVSGIVRDQNGNPLANSYGRRETKPYINAYCGRRKLFLIRCR